MLFGKGPSSEVVPVSVESSRTVELNAGFNETWSLYVAAPVEAFQPKVRVTGWSVAPFAGDESVGDAGGAGIVVKLHAVEYALVPPRFFAFTLQ